MLHAPRVAPEKDPATANQTHEVVWRVVNQDAAPVVEAELLLQPAVVDLGLLGCCAAKQGHTRNTKNTARSGHDSWK